MLLKDFLPTPQNNGRNVAVACRTAELAEEARNQGSEAMAERIEDCFIDLLNAMPKSERAVALMTAFDGLMKDAPPQVPQLRLVHSRD